MISELLVAGDTVLSIGLGAALVAVVKAKPWADRKQPGLIQPKDKRIALAAARKDLEEICANYGLDVNGQPLTEIRLPELPAPKPEPRHSDWATSVRVGMVTPTTPPPKRPSGITVKNSKFTAENCWVCTRPGLVSHQNGCRCHLCRQLSIHPRSERYVK